MQESSQHQQPQQHSRESKPVRGFWERLAREHVAHGEKLIALAPMADVTDTAFREMIATHSRMGEEGGGPHIMWTEFVSANGLASKGRDALVRDLEYTEKERPLVAQLFTNDPKTMYEAAKLCRELGFDGIDINMGCPDKTIEKQGAGSKLITTPRIAQSVVKAAQEGAGDIPVSVKTRLGFNKIEYKEWLPYILDMDVPALTVHLRTRKELSLVPAHWELAREVAKFVREYKGDALSGGPVLLANGDVKSVTHGKALAEESGFDGVMIGRAVFGTPWFFDEEAFNKGKTVEERLRISLEHVRLFEKKLGDIKSFAIMKKHYKAYAHGFDGAKELRLALMEAKTGNEIEEVVTHFLRTAPDEVKNFVV